MSYNNDNELPTEVEFKETSYTENPIVSTIEIQNEVPQVRPWIRYWARYLDTMIYAIILSLILGYAAPWLLEVNETLLGIVIAFTWVFFEALHLSTIGATPGKLIFRIYVRNRDGSKITFMDALMRSFRVWFRGLGMGISLVALITQILAYNKLKNDGITSWDRDGELVVYHKKIGVIRVLGAILLFVCFIALIILGTIY